VCGGGIPFIVAALSLASSAGGNSVNTTVQLTEGLLKPSFPALQFACCRPL